MCKKAAVIVLGLVLALGFVGKAQADWIVKAPTVTLAPGASFVLPFTATTDSNWNAMQCMFDFCADTGKIHVDSVTISGYGYFETVFDTCSEVGYAQYNFYVDSSSANGGCYMVQFAVLVMSGYVPVTNDEAIFAVWGHVDPSVTPPDTIEIDLTTAEDCGGGYTFDAVFATYPAANEMVASLEDGMILIPLYEIELSFSESSPFTMDEGGSATITVTGSSSENEDLTLQLVSGLESWMSWSGDVTGSNPSGTLELNPGYCDDGVYTVTFSLHSDLHDTTVEASIEIHVNNVNRAPSLVSVDPTEVTTAVGSPVTINVVFDDPDLACAAPHTSDALTLSYTMTPAPNGTVNFTDNGDGTGTLEFTPDAADVGTLVVTFTATDLGGESASGEATIYVNLVECCVFPTPDGYNACELFAFQIKKMCAYAGEEVWYPVYLHTPQHVPVEDGDSVEAYEVLLAWDPSCMTLLDVKEAKINGYYSEYFDYNIIPAGVVDEWPAVRVVEIRDKANNVYTPPIPPGCQVPIFFLKFRLNSDWDMNYACDVKFIVNECGDNTIATNDGLILHTPKYLARTTVTENCTTAFYYNVDFCPDDSLIEKNVALIDGYHWVSYELSYLTGNENDITVVSYEGCIDNACLAGDISAYELEYTTGDVNLNSVPYEVADADFFNKVLLGLYDEDHLPEGWNGMLWQRATLASDVNHNGTPWEMGDLVLMTAIITGFANPTSYNPPEEPVRVTVAGRDIYMDAPVDIGGVYLVVKYEGEMGTPVLGDMAEGMTLDWNDLGGELRIVIWSIDHNVISKGDGLLLTLPGSGKFTIEKIDVADFIGNTLSVEKGLASFALREAVPNPFKGTTKISFVIAKDSNVNLSIYDASGKLVRTLVNERLNAGEYSVSWDGKDNFGHAVKSGVYFYRLNAGSFTATRKLMLLK